MKVQGSALTWLRRRRGQLSASPRAARALVLDRAAAMGFDMGAALAQHGHGRRLGDLGDTLAILLLVIIILTGVCAFLGWYSRRRAG